MDAQTQIREEAVAFDHFARITDDVLLLIVSRLESLKHMCQCSLVSKRFASTIYKIQAVSLTLPSTEIPSDARADDINALFPELAGFTSDEAIRFIQSSSIHEMQFLPFLGNFRGLKSISLEFACANCLCSSSLFKMRVRVSKRGGGVVEKYVSIVADYVHKVTEWGYDDGRVYGPVGTMQSPTHSYRLAVALTGCLRCACSSNVSLLLRGLPLQTTRNRGN